MLISQVTLNWFLIAIASATAIAADPVLREIPASALPTVSPEGDILAFRVALKRQIESCERNSRGTPILFGSTTLTRKQWCLKTGRAFLELAEQSPDFDTLYLTAKTRFRWFQSSGATGRGDVAFTGYYFPSLEASRTPTARYSVPLYSRPTDLVQITLNGRRVWRRKNSNGRYSMFADRRAIDEGGALRGQNLEIAYVEDAYDAFIFEVQGAGALSIAGPGGTRERMVLNYSAQNGHDYVAIRRVLKEKGVAEEFLSMPGMKRYFQLNPAELKPVLFQNPSYVFFKIDTDGPLGTEVVLSPGHSIAIDPKAHPMGAVALFRTNKPVQSGDTVSSWQDMARFAVTQDVGGAIRGAKVDIYWGEGSDAEFFAGHMNQQGELFFPLLQ